MVVKGGVDFSPQPDRLLEGDNLGLNEAGRNSLARNDDVGRAAGDALGLVGHGQSGIERLDQAFECRTVSMFCRISLGEFFFQIAEVGREGCYCQG